jgi:hypothetical protein
MHQIKDFFSSDLQTWKRGRLSIHLPSFLGLTLV